MSKNFPEAAVLNSVITAKKFLCFSMERLKTMLRVLLLSDAQSSHKNQRKHFAKFSELRDFLFDHPYAKAIGASASTNYAKWLEEKLWNLVARCPIALQNVIHAVRTAMMKYFGSTACEYSVLSLAVMLAPNGGFLMTLLVMTPTLIRLVRAQTTAGAEELSALGITDGGAGAGAGAGTGNDTTKNKAFEIRGSSGKNLLKKQKTSHVGSATTTTSTMNGAQHAMRDDNRSVRCCSGTTAYMRQAEQRGQQDQQDQQDKNFFRNGTDLLTGKNAGESASSNDAKAHSTCPNALTGGVDSQSYVSCSTEDVPKVNNTNGTETKRQNQSEGNKEKENNSAVTEAKTCTTLVNTTGTRETSPAATPGHKVSTRDGNTYVPISRRSSPSASSTNSILRSSSTTSSDGHPAVTLSNYLELLVHASECRQKDKEDKEKTKQQGADAPTGGTATCTNTSCTVQGCTKMKKLIEHGLICSMRASGGCRSCLRLSALLRLHARECDIDPQEQGDFANKVRAACEPSSSDEIQKKECRVPACGAVKQHLRSKEKQRDSENNKKY